MVLIRTFLFRRRLFIVPMTKNIFASYSLKYILHFLCFLLLLKFSVYKECFLDLHLF